MSPINVKSTSWAKSSTTPPSTAWTKGSTNSTGFTKVAPGSGNWEPEGLFSDSYLLLQNGTDGMLLQDGINNLGLQA